MKEELVYSLSSPGQGIPGLSGILGRTAKDTENGNGSFESVVCVLSPSRNVRKKAQVLKIKP